jgi:hypothetical protein
MSGIYFAGSGLQGSSIDDESRMDDMTMRSRMKKIFFTNGDRERTNVIGAKLNQFHDHRESLKHDGS